MTSIAPIMTNIGVLLAGPVDPTDPPSEHVEELKHAQSYLEGQGVTADYVAGPRLIRRRRSPSWPRIAGADLIVVGHHHSAISPRLLGQSVSESVAHKVTCDVLLVS